MVFLHRLVRIALTAHCCFLGPSVAVALEVVSAAAEVPETISVAPSDFGDYGGDLFVPDQHATISGRREK